MSCITFKTFQIFVVILLVQLAPSVWGIYNIKLKISTQKDSIQTLIVWPPLMVPTITHSFVIKQYII